MTSEVCSDSKMCGTTCGFVSLRPIALNSRSVLTDDAGLRRGTRPSVLPPRASIRRTPRAAPGASSPPGRGARSAHTRPHSRRRCRCRTGLRRQASSTRRVPSTLTSIVSRGCATQSGMKCIAARWTTQLGSQADTVAVKQAHRGRPPRPASRPAAGTRGGRARGRRSPTTRCPADRSRSHSADPMKPAAPVTRMVRRSRSLAAVMPAPPQDA